MVLQAESRTYGQRGNCAERTIEKYSDTYAVWPSRGLMSLAISPRAILHQFLAEGRGDATNNRVLIRMDAADMVER